MNYSMKSKKKWVWFKKSCSENFYDSLKPKWHNLINEV